MSARMSRRQIMLAGAAATVVAAGQTGPAAAATAAPATAPPGMPTGAPLISVAAGSGRWPAGSSSVVNHDTSTTLQSFAVDSVNGRVYTLQGAGAAQVAYLRSGSQVAVTANLGAPQHSAAGDLCLTEYDLKGDVLGFMYLLGFGHGVSLGVEPASGSTPAQVWTEAGASPGGYGQEVVRFPFQSGTVLWTSHPAVQRFADKPRDAGSITPSVDVDHDVLLLRYAKPDGNHYFQAYRLSEAAAALSGGDRRLPSPLLADTGVPQPPLPKVDATGAALDPFVPATFQGFASYGQYVYMLDGDARPDTDDPAKPLSGYSKWTVHTSSFDLNAADPAATLVRTHSEADAGAMPREPEGMAVWTGAAGPLLLFALTNRTSSGLREFDLYSKPATSA
ncbi:hypothetical protein ACF061_13110 [Streptomyces sp. NPDC015220]|uniref:phage baseplate protein n=1 Tax=Streptomyces sp. NPDC015220 TaxID=3364947 RepID=UPI0036F6FB3B